MGYILNTNNHSISISTKSCYIGLIEAKLIENGSYLWKETNLLNLMFDKFGITSTDEMDLSDKTQLEFLKMVKANLWQPHHKLYSVNQSDYKTEKIYPNRFTAAHQLNSELNLGLLFFEYSWLLYDYIKGLKTEEMQGSLYSDFKQLEISNRPIYIHSCQGDAVSSTNELEFCRLIESRSGTKLFEAVSLENHLEQHYGVNNLFDLEKVDIPGIDAYLKYYQNFLAINAGDYLAPLYFILEEDGDVSNIESKQLHKQLKVEDSMRIKIATRYAQQMDPSFKNSRFSWDKECSQMI